MSQQGREIRYKILTLDLGIARANVEYLISGYNLAVISRSPTAAATIKLNTTTAEAIDLASTNHIESKFQRFYITNTAQTGLTIVLAIGEENFKLVSQLATSLLAGTQSIGTVTLGTGTNIIGAVNAQASGITVFNLASLAQTANGNSGDLSVSTLREIAVDVNISAVSGTAPTLNLYIDRKGADGIYYPIYASAQITAVGVVSTSLGIGASTPQSLGSTIRLRWVIGGTAPSFIFSASIIGK